MWEKARTLTVQIYSATRDFPNYELYGIRSQVRRAALSIGSNLAEGCGRDTDRELMRFSRVAMGSACEVEHLLIVSCDLEFLDRSVSDSLIESVVEVKRMLAAFVREVRKRAER